ncbi:MAG: alpha/beta hydrolase [Phycisphaerales bacterium]|nr:alpha/beta hydrolase [Phycisphaerales bacterium]
MQLIPLLAALAITVSGWAQPHRWAGTIDPGSGIPQATVVLTIDEVADTASVSAVGWNLPETSLSRTEAGWRGSIGGQSILIDGVGEADGPFEIKSLLVGPIRSATGTLQWSPLLSTVEGARSWHGTLDLPGMELDLHLRLAQVDERQLAELDIPQQGVDAAPLEVAPSPQGKLELVFYVGVPATLSLSETNDRLVGTFKQGGFEQAITLEPSDIAGPRRPQLPQPPFPYEAHEISVKHPEGHTLAGTLTVPHGEGPFPAAVLISGSGAQDRDETLMGHKPFLVIADDLTRNGIAVLRFDDRGVGGSHAGTSDLSDDTSIDFASDVELLVDHLRTRADIDGMKIGLIGHSEGGLIAPIVAAKRQDAVHFLVLLAGPGVPGIEILPAQMRALLLGDGEDPELVEKMVAQMTALLEAIRAEAPRETVQARARELIRTQMSLSPGTADMEIDATTVDEKLAAVGHPWMRAFLEIDPAEYLEQVRCPVLALNGTLDLQVLVDQNLPAIESVLQSNGVDVTAHRLEGLNHLFQPATNGTIDEYARIEVTFDPATLELISTWIKARMGVAQ